MTGGAGRKLGSVVETVAILAQDTSQKQDSDVVQTSALLPAPHVSLNPLDPVQLEHWVLDSSGLLKIRPPMPAAESGSDNVYIIPFQVRRSKRTIGVHRLSGCYQPGGCEPPGA